MELAEALTARKTTSMSKVLTATAEDLQRAEAATVLEDVQRLFDDGALPYPVGYNAWVEQPKGALERGGRIWHARWIDSTTHRFIYDARDVQAALLEKHDLRVDFVRVFPVFRVVEYKGRRSSARWGWARIVRVDRCGRDEHGVCRRKGCQHNAIERMGSRKNPLPGTRPFL